MKQTAIITGASSGIGLELARLFAKDNYELVLVALENEPLQKLAAELAPSVALAIPKDLSALGAVDQIISELKGKNIHIDVLVNCAGIGDFAFFAQSQWEKQERMINLNVAALTHLTHALLPAMVKNKRGKILNIASTAAFQPGPTMSVYYATKAYVLHFTEAIANELEGSGVTVTALCPGATRSGFQNAANMNESRLVKGKKLPSPPEVAEFGYKALMKGKRVAIHRWSNYLLANAVRFLPRNVVVRMVRKAQDRAD